MARISQREARRLRKRVSELEDAIERQRNTYAQTYFGATEIARCSWSDDNAAVPTAVRVARRLRHAVVAVGDETGLIRFMALPQAKQYVG